MSDQNQAEMPRYRCHKVVHALKIDGIIEVMTDGQARLRIAEPGFAPITVAQEVVSRRLPIHGDYLVVYEDGYQSISPGKAFEDGYSRI